MKKVIVAMGELAIALVLRCSQPALLTLLFTAHHRDRRTRTPQREAALTQGATGQCQ